MTDNSWPVETPQIDITYKEGSDEIISSMIPLKFWGQKGSLGDKVACGWTWKSVKCPTLGERYFFVS